MLVAGVDEPDPLVWVCNLRNSYPGRLLPIAILHSPTELATLSLALAAKRFREMEPPWYPTAHQKQTILVDHPGHQLIVNGTQQKLSPVEFRLFLFLIRYSGVVFSRAELLHRTRSSETAVDPRIIDVMIARLRARIDRAMPARSHFTTLYGIGYGFLRHGDAFIDGFTRRPFESWPCCPDAAATQPA